MAHAAQESITLLTTDETAAMMGVSRGTVCNICRANPGFAVRFGHAFKIPLTHIQRVMSGERPADIAAEVRAVGASRAA
jgi:hypothetical protein